MPSDQLSTDLASLRIDRSATSEPRRSFPGWLIWLVLAAIVGGVAYFVAYPRLQSALFKTAVSTGEIALVSPAQAQVQLTATGYVVAQSTAKVAAKVNGRVAELFVEEGQAVTKGDKIARLDDIDQKSEIAAARARGAASRARVQTARNTLAETKQMLAREQKLVESGVSPEATAADLKARLDSLVASVRAAEAEAAATEAEARTLEVQLGNYIVTAPISGTVVEKLIEVGESVSPGFGLPGIVDLVDMSSLVVEIDVPEGRLEQVAVGAPCEVVLDAYPAQRYRGDVKEIGRRINRAKATVPVKVRFIDRPPQVLPEMAARVSFLAAALDEKTLKEPPRLVVPSAAVLERGGNSYVFVVEDNVVHLRLVKLGAPFGDGRTLETPIPAGTKVVLDPPASLTDGQAIKEKSS